MVVTERHEQVWVGIDAGKAHHWAVGVNATGEKVLSRKVVNGEDEILDLIVAACEMADEVRWAIKHLRSGLDVAACVVDRQLPERGVRAWSYGQPHVWRLPRRRED
ncbi:hypothetical protein RKD27_000103 [Streptomyces sp. SAI-126]